MKIHYKSFIFNQLTGGGRSNTVLTNTDTSTLGLKLVVFLSLYTDGEDNLWSAATFIPYKAATPQREGIIPCLATNASLTRTEWQQLDT